jgi:hypothetical protein
MIRTTEVPVADLAEGMWIITGSRVIRLQVDRGVLRTTGTYRRFDTLQVHEGRDMYGRVELNARASVVRVHLPE